MYISGTEAKARAAARTAFAYLLVSLFCAVFGGVYEVFSHQVYSFYMLYAFLFPLAGGALPFSVFHLAGGRKYPGAAARGLYHAGLAALTVGSLLRGVLDIYGTTNRLAGWYWIAGFSLLAAGLAVYLLQWVRPALSGLGDNGALLFPGNFAVGPLPHGQAPAQGLFQLHGKAA